MRVMTFNLRYPSRSDEGNLWEDRRDLVADLVRSYAPDVLGVQEAYRSQLEWLCGHLDGRACIARERYGAMHEEHAAIFLRTDRFMVESCGTFWLSAEPDSPGSRSWRPDDHPRIVTWARIREIATALPIAVLNTHFHLGDDDLRAKGARLAWDRTPRDADLPVIFTGDFNSMPGSAPHRLLTGRDPLPDGSRADCRDAWEVAGERIGPDATFHRFTGRPAREGARIDWILVRGPIRVTRVETIVASRGDRYPSDHFPVVADIAFEGATA